MLTEHLLVSSIYHGAACAYARTTPESGYNNTLPFTLKSLMSLTLREQFVKVAVAVVAEVYSG